MKKKKKTKRAVISAILSIALLIIAPGSTVSAAAEAPGEPLYKAFSGKIIGVTQGDAQIIMAEAADGSREQFKIGSSTYIDSSAAIANGSEIIAFYDQNQLLWQPSLHHYFAEAVVSRSDAVNVLLGKFDENLVNEANTLKLNNTGNAEIILSGGEAYTGELANQKLLVFYTASTRSIPAQTTPVKIVVFPEIAAVPNPAPGEIPQIAEGAYGSFAGKAVSIFGDNAVVYVMLENKEGEQTQFSVSGETFLLNGAKLEEGQDLIGFYELRGMAPAIYPPRYYASVIAAADKEAAIFVGLFGADMVSADGNLKLLNTDKAKAVYPDGSNYAGTLENQTLAVFYRFATFSIPAQTSPDTIVVLQKKEYAANISEMQIIVDGRPLAGITAVENDNGAAMVPLRAIAEVLGFPVAWEAVQRTVTIGDGYSLQIGSNQYTSANNEAVALGEAPIIYGERTYVPLDFFTSVLRLNNAYIFENQIVIDNGEKME